MCVCVCVSFIPPHSSPGVCVCVYVFPSSYLTGQLGWCVCLSVLHPTSQLTWVCVSVCVCVSPSSYLTAHLGVCVCVSILHPTSQLTWGCVCVSPSSHPTAHLDICVCVDCIYIFVQMRFYYFPFSCCYDCCHLPGVREIEGEALRYVQMCFYNPLLEKTVSSSVVTAVYKCHSSPGPVGPWHLC